MRSVIQRVSSASVRVEGRIVGTIGTGLVVLAGIEHEDGPEDVKYIAGKAKDLRIFDDAQGRMNRSVADAGGEILVVSQFTLCGDGRRGRRPSFDAAARPEAARPLYDALVAELRALGLKVETGRISGAYAGRPDKRRPRHDSAG